MSKHLTPSISKSRSQFVQAGPGTQKHNKFSESVFGFLDTLLRIKPNISILASEAFVMFTANKTKEWFETKSEANRNKLISKAMHDVSRVRENYRKRTAEIEANQKIRVEEGIQRAEAAEARRLNRLEEYSKKIIFFGLWQSEQEVYSALNEIKKKGEKLEALKAQLNFRRHVLKQHPSDPNCYSLSINKQKLTVEEITVNVVKLVNHALTIQPVNTNNNDQPILTGKDVEHCFEEDGEQKWWRGKVISQVPGYPEYYNIVYQGGDGVYVYRLQEDYKRGDLRIAAH